MSQQKRLSWLLVLNLAMIAGLILVGLTSHSLGVLAAGGDYIADSLAIILGLMAIYLRDKRGQHKAPAYVALVNGLFLLLVTAIVMYQAARRLLTHAPEIHGLPVLIVSAISTVMMLIGAVILGRGAGTEDLHMHSVLLDTVSDGLAALSVAIVGGIIYFTSRLYWLDSAVALIIGLLIGYGAIRLLRDVYTSLRLGTPIEPNDG